MARDLRHGSHGFRYEPEAIFNATLLHPDRYTRTLTVPAGKIFGGLIYDYLEVEPGDVATASSP